MTPAKNRGEYHPPGFSYGEVKLMEKKHKEITALAKKHFSTQDDFDQEAKKTLPELSCSEYKYLRESLIASSVLEKK
jgi:hypothetical protein